MFRRLKEKVCSKCEKCEWCWGENFIHTYQMGYEVLSAVDHYGNDLKTEHDLDQPDCKKQRGMCDPTGYFCGYASEQCKGTGGKYFYG